MAEQKRITGKELARRQRLLARGALELAANDLLGEGQRLAPVEEGTLRGSGEVELEVHGDHFEATVSFSTPYAAVQHEELSFQHPKGGQAKYLEAPFKEKVPKMERLFAEAASKAVLR